MGPTQSCYVCGETGEFVGRPLVVPAGGGPHARQVGQCPRCDRFICSEHAEPLDLSPRSRLWPFGAKRRELTLCCPFDPGIALGSRDG